VCVTPLRLDSHLLVKLLEALDFSNGVTHELLLTSAQEIFARPIAVDIQASTERVPRILYYLTKIFVANLPSSIFKLGLDDSQLLLGQVQIDPLLEHVS